MGWSAGKFDIKDQFSDEKEGAACPDQQACIFPDPSQA
jgi:hypothetical protein